MKHLIQDIRQFNEERDWEQFHSPKNLAMALVVEASEVAEIFQWLTEEESRSLSPQDHEKVRQEIGDVFIYLVSLADQLDIGPLKAAKDKMCLNAARYPVEKARGQAKKYTEYES